MPSELTDVVSISKAAQLIGVRPKTLKDFILSKNLAINWLNTGKAKVSLIALRKAILAEKPRATPQGCRTRGRPRGHRQYLQLTSNPDVRC